MAPKKPAPKKPAPKKKPPAEAPPVDLGAALEEAAKKRPTCGCEGCARPATARGLCFTHYNTWRRGGRLPPLRRGA